METMVAWALLQSTASTIILTGALWLWVNWLPQIDQNRNKSHWQWNDEVLPSSTTPWFHHCPLIPPSSPTSPRFPGARYLAIGRDEIFTNWDIPHRAISLRGLHTYSQQTLARHFPWSGEKTSGWVTPMNWQITATCSGRNFTWHNWGYSIPNYKPLNPFLTLGRCSKKQKKHILL